MSGAVSGSPTADCSVVIRCFNEERHIGRLLEGILHQTVRPVDIVVVDSGSIDATLSIASRYPTRIVRIEPERFSFGRALNLGFAAASGSVLVTASAHVYPVYEDWLERLLAPFSDPVVALAYGRQRGDRRTRPSEHRVFARWFPDTPAADQQHPFCNNANAAVRRSVWAALPYNEELTGLEDVDWAHRARQLGHRIAYTPDAEVAHVHEETARRIYNRYRREAIALHRIFPHERFGLADFLRLWLGNVAADAAWSARRGRLLQEAGDIVLFRTMQMWGTYRGFAHRGALSGSLLQAFYYPNGWAGRAEEDRRTAREIDYGEAETHARR